MIKAESEQSFNLGIAHLKWLMTNRKKTFDEAFNDCVRIGYFSQSQKEQARAVIDSTST